MTNPLEQIRELADEVEACWICASIGDGEITLETINHWSGRLSAILDASQGYECVPVAWMRRTIRHKRIGGREEGERVMSASKVYPDDEPLFTHPPAASTNSPDGEYHDPFFDVPSPRAQYGNVITVVVPTPPKDRCDHEWVDARNQYVVSGELCLKCLSIRSGNTTPPKADGSES